MTATSAPRNDDTYSTHSQNTQLGSPRRTLKQVCDNFNHQIQQFLDRDLTTEPETLRNVQSQTRQTLAIIASALRKYNLSELSLSYNGGKDCLVLLILFLASLSTCAYPLPPALQSVYIISPHPFKEVDEFVDWSVAEWCLDLSRYSEGMKEGFEKYLNDKAGDDDMKKKRKGNRVKAIMVGTRRTDPHGGRLGHFEMTDKGWPSFMRIHPVIEWHYVEIWTVSSFPFFLDLVCSLGAIAFHKKNELVEILHWRLRVLIYKNIQENTRTLGYK